MYTDKTFGLLEIIDSLSDCIDDLQDWNEEESEEINEQVNKLSYIACDLQAYLDDLIEKEKEI